MGKVIGEGGRPQRDDQEGKRIKRRDMSGTIAEEWRVLEER